MPRMRTLQGMKIVGFRPVNSVCSAKADQLSFTRTAVDGTTIFNATMDTRGQRKKSRLMKWFNPDHTVLNLADMDISF